MPGASMSPLDAAKAALAFAQSAIADALGGMGEADQACFSSWAEKLKAMSEALQAGRPDPNYRNMGKALADLNARGELGEVVDNIGRAGELYDRLLER